MISEKIKKQTYRLDIDGLRAFAVLAVIINHFSKEALPGGFLGVDIFFVISGFVITSSLNKKKSTNFLVFIFSFYERRIKRLIPALISFVLITSLLICFFNPEPGSSLITGLSSLFGFSNIYLFLKNTDYFAASTELNVFTHTWSLGVEEQFYLIFPLLCWCSGFSKEKSKGSKYFFLLILFLTITSLLTFIHLYQINQFAAYYLLPSRFWEIATGSLLFLGINTNNPFKKILKVIPCHFILLAIIFLMFLPASSANYSIIFTVLLTSLLIASLKKNTLIYDVLTNKKIVYLGSISYSLYLWHWSILSISRWTIGISWWTVPIQISLIYFISVFSYEKIENPLREKIWSKKKWVTIFKGILTLIFSGLAIFILGKPLKGKTFLGNETLEVDQKIQLKQPYFQNLRISSDCHDMEFKNGYDHQKVLTSCLIEDDDNLRTIFFIGDSHMHSLWLGAEFIANKTNSNLFTFTTGSTLFPPIKYFRPDNKEKLLLNNSIFKSLQNEVINMVEEGDIIFISVRMPYHFGKDWYEYKASEFRYFDNNNKVVLRDSKQQHFEDWLQAIDKFTTFLGKRGVKVVINTPSPEFPLAKNKQCLSQNLQWFNKFNKSSCKTNLDFYTSPNGQYYEIIKGLNEIASKHENLYLFNLLKLMCPNSLCSYSLNGKLLYRDKDHISNYGSLFIYGPKVIEFINRNKLIK